jgi:hypothetical protein
LGSYVKATPVLAAVRGLLLATAAATIITLAFAPFAHAGVRADFNGDGRSDLAITARSEVVGSREGAVHILYGARHGLSVRGDQLVGEGTPGLEGGGASNDGSFGFALAAGDLNGDGYDELAIGVPHKTLPSPGLFQGAVHILYGTRRGVTLRGDQYLTENTPGIKGPGASGEFEGPEFGEALASGDFDRDGRDDLAIGVPGQTVLSTYGNDGAVHVLYGGRRRLSLRGDQYFTSITPGMVGPRERSRDADFGAALAAGDLNRDGSADLVIGSPDEPVWRVKNAGAVRILFGGRRRLSLKGDRYLTEQTKGIAGDGREYGDRFGLRLVIGRFNGDRRGDLAIGVPEESGQHFWHEDGAVHILYGGRRGPSLDGDQYLTETHPGLKGPGALQSQFGGSLAVGDLNGDGRQELTIGALSERVSGAWAAGAVHILYGAKRHLTLKGDQFLTEATPGMLGPDPQPDNYFGRALAAGDLNGDGRSDLAIGVPQYHRDDYGDCLTSAAGAVHILYGAKRRLRLRGNQRLTLDTPGVAGGGSEPCDNFGSSLSGAAR